MKLENPFTRRDSINRTPPRARSMSATQIGVLESDQEDLCDEDRKKRKRIDSPKKLFAEIGKDVQHRGKANIEVYALEEALITITKIAKGLEKRIEKNTNREMKALIERLKRQVEVVNGQRLRKWLDDHKYEGIEKIGKDMDTQTDEHLQKCQSTQTKDEHKLLTLEAVETHEEWLQIADKEWHKDLFLNTETKEGSPLNTKDSTVKVIVVDEKDKAMEQGLQKAFKDRYPELGETNEEFEVLEQTTMFRTAIPNQQKVRKVIRITWNDSEEDLFRNIIKLKKETANDNWIAMHEIAGISLSRLRKMVEGIFHSTGVNVTIYNRKNRSTTAKTNKDQTYALVVQDKNRTYNEMLKDVKTVLASRGTAEGLRGIRSTKDGGMLLTIDKDEEALNKIQKALRESKTEGSEIWRVGQGRETDAVHIKGIDALTTKAEVMEALEKSIPDLGNKYHKLGDLRPMINNTQAVTLILNKQDTKLLCQKRNIQIGLVRCNIERRIALRRCNKCWTYGHKAEECNGTDRSKMCFRCGTGGHTAAKCTKEERCPICDEEGHRAGSGKCKNFKRALSQARGLERKQDYMSQIQGSTN